MERSVSLRFRLRGSMVFGFSLFGFLFFRPAELLAQKGLEGQAQKW